MASINASTSGAGGVITTADNTGTLQLQSGGTTIATVSSTGLALNTGNITLPSGAAPAFSVYANAGQSFSSNTTTKVLYGVEEFDTNNNFSTATSTFTPTVAGYYQINAQVQPNDFFTGVIIAIYKNGSLFKYGNYNGASNIGGSVVAALVYCNGSTDAINIFANFTGGQPIASGPAFTYFQGFLARSA
jgi:hypothetical protein